MIPHKKALKSNERVEFVNAVFLKQFFKSFRLSGIQERIAHYVYQYLTEGGVYNRIKRFRQF